MTTPARHMREQLERCEARVKELEAEKAALEDERMASYKATALWAMRLSEAVEERNRLRDVAAALVLYVNDRLAEHERRHPSCNCEKYAEGRRLADHLSLVVHP